MTTPDVIDGPAPDVQTPLVARLGPVARLALRAPFSLGLTVALWVVGAATGSLTTGPHRLLLHQVGVGVTPLADGHWWVLVSSALFSSGLAGYLAVTVLLVAACAPMERLIGTSTAVLVFVGCQVAATCVALGVVYPASRVGDLWAGHLANAISVGPSAGAMGLLLAGSAMLDPLWRRRTRVLVLAALVTTVLYAGDLPDVMRLVAGLVGLVLGASMFGRRPPAPVRWLPGGDGRALVALLVAASALGPISTILGAHRYGPLSAVNFLFLPSLDPDVVAQWCAGDLPLLACRSASTALLVQGIGPLFQTLLPVLVLLTLAEGLRRGRRSAYLGTLTVNLGLAVIGALLSQRELTDLISDHPGHPVTDSEFWIIRLAPTVLPLAIAVLVFFYRKEFPVRMPWQVHRSWVLVTATAAITVAGGYVMLGWAVREQFRPAPTFWRLLESLPGRFAPVGYLAAGRNHFFPTGPIAVGLYEWAGAAFWAVTLGMTVASFWRSRGMDVQPDREAASQILRRYGGASSLAYMTLWRGNHYWFTPDGSTMIAYRVIAAVAVTTGDPIGPRPAPALRGFLAHCAAAGWTPCFFSVTNGTADLLRPSGFRTLQVASDTVLEPKTLAFTGKRWQDVRSAFNRAKRDDVHAQWSTYGELPRTLADQIVAIDRQWLQEKGLPEMGFTLGGLAELEDPEVRCLLAVDANDHVVAVTSWLPGFRGGQVIGWTLDFMRRGPDAFPGAMEFLIATALTAFRDEGAVWISLSGVPLAWPEGEGPDGALGRSMDAMAQMLEPVYGFRSLLAFKAKFAPRYRPLLLAYPDPAALPTVTNAVLRAYVPHLGPTQLARLMRQLLRPKARSNGHHAVRVRT